MRKVGLSSVLVVAGLVCAQSRSPPSLDDAQKAEKAGNYAQAESIYRAILHRQPSADLYQRLGLVQHLQNKFAEASAAFQNALHLNGNLWNAHLFLGIDEYRMNRFSEALAHLESSERLYPGQAETRFWLGASHLALHQYLDGLEDLELVLEKDPHNVEVLRLLAESYADHGTQLLNQIAEKYPDSAAGLQVQARALEFEGSNEAALQYYRKAAAKDPDRPGIKQAIARLGNITP